MACRRSLTIARAKLFGQQRIITPSLFSYVNHDEDRKNSQHSDNKVNFFLQSQSYGVSGNKTNTGLAFGGSGISIRDPKWSRLINVPPLMTTTSGSGFGYLVARNMSTSIGNGSNMTHILADQTMEAVSTQAAAVSEVAIAAADSWFPVAALQYAIDGVHMYTGLNWWAAIAVTTLIIKTLLIPVMIHRLKASSKISNLTPKIEEIKQDIDDQRMGFFEGNEQIHRLFKEHGVHPLAPLMGIVIDAPIFISFFFALENMVEKVPSFTTGGVSWFLDLTATDPFYILPVASGFLFWLNVEFGTQEGMEGNARAAMMKNVARGFAALSIPFSASFPQAIFCYWISSSLFGLVYGLIFKQEQVRKFFNIPKIVPHLQSQSSFGSPFEMLKKCYSEYLQQQQRAAGISNPRVPNLQISTSQQQKSANGGVSSTSVLSNRIRNLEKKVKGKKKNKKR
ncbi:mitochondrial inner membrane protein OXA1-like [Rutidosis leptorrhynchoides]|uniref:mitochondrial inner membrane protein OXA1-like n=1 Tax=Rutidosis leptorrhynchoides TaxID=125765 RepID=UPI003A9A2EEB